MADIQRARGGARADRGQEMDDGRCGFGRSQAGTPLMSDNYSRISDNYGDSLESRWAPAERTAGWLAWWVVAAQPAGRPAGRAKLMIGV